MRQIYNKGRYRGYEWDKHISPFLRKVCNRKWRHDGKAGLRDFDEDMLLAVAPLNRRKYKKPRSIVAKITYKWYGGLITTRRLTFKSERSFEESIKRANVLRVYVIRTS